MARLNKMYYAFVQNENEYSIYLYDDVKQFGNFNWETWKREESETSAKHFRTLLQEIPEDAEISLFINSAGGDVAEGTAIYNELKRHPAHITGYVDGIAHSIAFTILQACDHRIMGEGTSVVLHNMWMYAAGNADELRNEADKLDAWMDASRKLILQKTDKVTEEELKEMMDKETLLGPDKALEYGFIDEIAGRQALSTEGVLQAVANENKIRQGMKDDEFDEALEEFEKLAKETKQKEEDAPLMEAFFNMFL